MTGRNITIPEEQFQAIRRLVLQDLKQKQIYYGKAYNLDVKEEYVRQIDLLQMVLITLQKA
jgi:hypothetical protein